MNCMYTILPYVYSVPIHTHIPSLSSCELRGGVPLCAVCHAITPRRRHWMPLHPLATLHNYSGIQYAHPPPFPLPSPLVFLLQSSRLHRRRRPFLPPSPSPPHLHAGHLLAPPTSSSIVSWSLDLASSQSDRAVLSVHSRVYTKIGSEVASFCSCRGLDLCSGRKERAWWGSRVLWKPREEISSSQLCPGAWWSPAGTCRQRPPWSAASPATQHPSARYLSLCTSCLSVLHLQFGAVHIPTDHSVVIR